MRTAEQKFKILRVLSHDKWERAEAIARETGLSKRLTTTLLKEMAADGLVDMKILSPAARAGHYTSAQEGTMEKDQIFKRQYEWA